MSNNIKGNHIRHTQEALDDILEGLEKHDLKSLDFGVSQLVAFGLELGHNEHHCFECLYPETYLTPGFDDPDYLETGQEAKLVENMLHHEYYDKNGDVWQDAVETLMIKLYELINKEKK